MVYASIHLQREYKGKSVAVLPQTVVVPAGIPSLEPCLGVLGLNAEHLGLNAEHPLATRAIGLEGPSGPLDTF